MTDFGTEIPKSEFDRLCRAGGIADAQVETFGDGPGEPYNPHRRAFGTHAGKRGHCWISGRPAAAEANPLRRLVVAFLLAWAVLFGAAFGIAAFAACNRPAAVEVER